MTSRIVIYATNAHRCVASTHRAVAAMLAAGAGAPGGRRSPLRLVDQPHEMRLLCLPHAEASASDVRRGGGGGSGGGGGGQKR